jgi:hypothetical protein
VIAPTAEPFPHVVLKDYWPDDFLEQVLAEVPPPESPYWRRYTAPTEAGKCEASNPATWGPTTQKLYERLGDLRKQLQEAFEVPTLTLDSIGGGYHMTGPGGRLAVHTDFNRHGELFRRLNALVFLNHDWRREYGGVLELHGTDSITEVLPEFNTTVIFATSDTSWHGHPTPVADGHYRRSFAAYYFTKAQPDGYESDHSTIWHPSEGT